MTADLPAIKRDLAAFDFTSLFIERLGWDHLRTRLPIQVGDEAFVLHGIAGLCIVVDGANGTRWIAIASIKTRNPSNPAYTAQRDALLAGFHAAFS